MPTLVGAEKMDKAQFLEASPLGKRDRFVWNKL